MTQNCSIGSGRGPGLPAPRTRLFASFARPQSRLYSAGGVRRGGDGRSQCSVASLCFGPCSRALRRGLPCGRSSGEEGRCKEAGVGPRF